MKKKAILFIAHCINEDTMSKYQKVSSEMSDSCDVFWAFQKETNKDIILPEGIRFFIFNFASLRELKYEALYDKEVYGSVNFIIQRFFKDYPEYEYYWSIEYDVIFTGNWHTIIDAFDNVNADLISCHIERYTKGKNEYWDWWKPLVWIDEDIPLEKCIKAFNPIFCLSSKAIAFLDGFLQKGNSGHFETVMSTALHYYGYKLVDMGGTGEFILPGFQNKFYVQGAGTNNGTMRFRPIFLKEEIEALDVPNKLFHPLK